MLAYLLTFAMLGVAPGADKMATLVVTFEAGMKPDRAAAKNAAPLRHGKVKLIAGRGGKVLEVPRYALGVAYSSEVLNPGEGTVEFWFASRHDPKIKGKEHPAYTLWSAEARNHTGISSWIAWNRNLVFRTASGYKNLTRFEIGGRALDDRKWHHLAYTWNEHYLAVFIDGRLRGVSRGRTRFPHGISGVLFIGYRSSDEQVETLKPVKNPASAMGLFDDLRVSRAVRYHAQFQPPDKDFRPRSGEPEVFALEDMKAPAVEHLKFSVDFENGFMPAVGPKGKRILFKQGDAKTSAGRRGKALEIASSGSMSAVLCYQAGDALDRFLGTIDLWFSPRWEKPIARRALVDLAGIPGTGYLLCIEKDGRLAFLTFEGGKELGRIQTAPISWKADQWHPTP